MGTLDAACDHIGQSKWMAQMEWTGQQGFLAAPTEKWWVDGEVAGSVKTHGDLTVSIARKGSMDHGLTRLSCSRCSVRDILYRLIGQRFAAL